MKNFAAIDFEGANRILSSVCSVGVVVVRNGVMTDHFYSLIKPTPNFYEWGNTRVHGLKKKDTKNAPLFPDVWKKVSPLIDGLPLVAHNKVYDENCLKAAFARFKMTYPQYKFYDTYTRALKVWSEGPYTLNGVAERCGYKLDHHHNALADAEACAAIAIQIL